MEQIAPVVLDYGLLGIGWVIAGLLGGIHLKREAESRKVVDRLIEVIKGNTEAMTLLAERIRHVGPK